MGEKWEELKGKLERGGDSNRRVGKTGKKVKKKWEKCQIGEK